MTLKKKLAALMREVIAEADTNPDFCARLEAALGANGRTTVRQKAPAGRPRDSRSPQPKRPSHRRPPAVLDPVQLAREGEQQLREALGCLNLEQLRDVVADYGMDPGKLVMKWRDDERVVDRIVEVAVSRAHKGSAFSGAVSDVEAASDTASTDGIAKRKD